MTISWASSTRSATSLKHISVNTRGHYSDVHQLNVALNEHALNKIVRTHTLLRVLIARLDCLAGYKRGVPWAEVFAMRTNMAAIFKLLKKIQLTQNPYYTKSTT